MGKWSTSSPSSPMSSSPPSLSWDFKRCSLSAAHLFYLNPGFIHCDCHPGWFCRWYHWLLPEPGLGTTLQRFWHLGGRLHPGREIFWRRKKTFLKFVCVFFSALTPFPPHPSCLMPHFFLYFPIWRNKYIQYQYIHPTDIFPPNCWQFISNTNIHITKCTILGWHFLEHFFNNFS